MTTESRADFARRMGWNRSSVTRAVQDGRVVLQGDMVDVEASLAKIEALAHPAPHHQAHVRQLEEARAAKSRTVAEAVDMVEAKISNLMSGGEGLSPSNQGGSGKPEGEDKPKEDIEALNLRLKRAEADKREHEAEMARMERETMAGNLIAREDVEFALDNFGATLRSLMDNLADRLAPVVYPLQSMEETRAALAEAANDVLQTMNEQLQRRAGERRQS